MKTSVEDPFIISQIPSISSLMTPQMSFMIQASSASGFRLELAIPQSKLSELHNDIFGEFSLGPDIRNLASYKFNEIQGKKT